MIILKKIKISFDDFVVFENLNIEFHLNAINTIVGKNGVGKSTIASILSGSLIPNSGEILINGKKVVFTSMKDAEKMGIGIVTQNFLLFDELNGYENILLNSDCNKKQIKEVSKKYFSNLDLNIKVKNLENFEKQELEILKILLKNSNIIIFDEPTSSLSYEDIKNFAKIIKELKKTIIIISHNMNDILNFSDHVFLLKEKSIVEKIENLNSDSIKNVFSISSKNQKYFSENKKVILKYSNIKLKNYILDFQLNKGEILGVISLNEKLKKSFFDIIRGKNSFKTVIEIENQKFENFNIKNLRNNNIFSLSEESYDFSITNDTLFNNFNLYNETNSDNYDQILKEFNINGKLMDIFENLSLGNQQKCLIGKELFRDFKSIIFFNASKGLDMLSKRKLYDFLISSQKKGKSFIIISNDIEEIIEISNRVLILGDKDYILTNNMKNLEESLKSI